MFTRRCTSLVLSLAMGAFLVSRLTPTIAQEETPPPRPAPAVDDITKTSATGEVTVQLIRVRSVWSYGKDAEEAERTLETLLKDSTLPDHYRETLLSWAPRILFPEGFVACYRPDELSDSLAWMKERDLAREDAQSEPMESRPYREGSREHVIHRCNLYVGSDAVPIEPNLVRGEIPPFVTRTLGWEWNIESCRQVDESTGEATVELFITRDMMKKDELQVDEKKTVTKNSMSGRVSGVRIPTDKVTVIRCFGADDQAYGISQTVRNQDWVPLLVVSPIALKTREASDDPQLSKPSSLVKQTTWRPRWTAAKYPRRSPNIAGYRPAPADVVEPERETVVLRFKHADPTHVLRALIAVVPDAEGVIDSRLNALLVTATKDDLTAVQNLVTELDQPATDDSSEARTASPEERQIKVFRLKNAEAAQPAAMINQLFKEIRVSADKRSNSLIVFGTPEDLEIVEAILLRLDQTPTKLQDPTIADDPQPAYLDSTRSDFSAKATADDPEAAAAKAIVRGDDNLNVQLIRVRSDWSEAKDPEAAKKALETVVDGVSLPDNVRNNLLSSASQILCPEGFIAGYRPDEYLDLLTWMKGQDLVQTHAQSKPILWRGFRKDRPDLEVCRSDLFVAESVVPVSPTLERSEVPPFFERTYGWMWSFESCLEKDPSSEQATMEVKFTRSSVAKDDPQLDGGSPVVLALSSTRRIGSRFPAELVGIVRCFELIDDATKEAIQQQGWEPMLVITSANLRVSPSSSIPLLRRPTSLQKLDFSPMVWATVPADTQFPQGSPSQAAVTGKTHEADDRASESTKRIVVFRLQHAQAGQLAELLQAVMTDGGVKADERTNSLLVFGTTEQIDALRGLIENLDIAPTSEAVSGKSIAHPNSIEATRTDYATKQKEAASLARSLADETDEKTAKQLRTRLDRLVTEAFDLRQKLQRAELALLKERMQIVETRLQQRNVLRKEIIARRVENLLSGEFDRASLEPSHVAPRIDATTATEAAKTTRPNGSIGSAAGNSWDSDDAIRFLNTDDREAAWTMAYKEQRSQNAWPPPLSRQFHDGIKRLGPDASLPSSMCEEYHKFIRATAPDIDRIIDRRRPIAAEEPLVDASGQAVTAEGIENDAENASQQLMGGYGAGLGMQTGQPAMEGIVEWNEADYARIQAGFYWVARPSTEQVRLAQEDLWCYEGILRSIAKTNKDAGATSYDDAPIKRIEAMEIGRPAAIAMASLRPKLALQAYFGKAYGLTDWIARQAIEEPTGVEAFEQVHSSGGRAEEQIAERLRMSRYVDLAGTPLAAGLQPYPEFKLLPVRLVVDIDQTQLPGFLAQLAAGAMPVDVKYVEAEDMQSEEDSDAYGAPIRKNHVRAEILGLIRIFNPPDIKKLVASVVRGGAPVDTLSSIERCRHGVSGAMREILELENAIAKAEGRGDTAETERLRQLLPDLQGSLAGWRFLMENEIVGLGLQLQEYETAVPATFEVLEEAKRFQEKGLKTPAEVAEASRQYQQAQERVTYTKQTIGEFEQLLASVDWQSLPGSGLRKTVPKTPDRTTPPAPLGPRSSSQLRTPEDLAIAATAAQNQLRRAQWDLDLESEREADVNESPYGAYPSHDAFIERMKGDVVAAQQRLELVQAEYATQLRIRSLEVQSAETDANAAKEELDRYEALFKTGALSTSEMQEARRKHEQATLRVEAAKTLLELYRKAGESPDLMPSTATSQDQPVTPTGTGRAESNTKTGTPTTRAPNTPTSSALGARPTLQLRSPADFQSAARDAKKQVGLMQAKLDSVLGDRQSLEDRLDFDYTAYLDSVKEDLSSAKLQLDLIQAEFIAQVRYLELEVERRIEALEGIRQTLYSGTLPRLEKVRAETARVETQLQISQAETLLELYQKAGESADLKPGYGGQLESNQTGNEGPVPRAEVLPQNWANSMFKETQHDFGTVAKGAKLEHRFTIENPYLEDVHIAQVAASPGLSARVTKPLLKTHETADIVVEVDPRQFSTAAPSRVMVELDKPFPAQIQLDVRLSKKPANEAPE